MSLWAVAPFALMLAAIAFCPLALRHWWEPNRNKLAASIALSAPIIGLYLVHRPWEIAHALQEYVSFMILLTGLYVVAGGVALTGDLEATPLTNTAILATGSVLASAIGTTGASMVLIRLLLRTNRERTRVQHTVIFFIFLVANIGGVLTPLGDPPLFLGYLRGVPFPWTFRLWPAWAVTVAFLLAVYFVWDSILHAREPLRALRRDRAQLEPVRLRGGLNLAALLGVVVAVVLLGPPWREAVIVGIAGLSAAVTPRAIRAVNRFSMYPMAEVAALFLGIFLTMIPALELLRVHAAALGVREPWQFFWIGGLLSSVLDNAPTYLTFLTLAQGLALPAEVAGMPHRVLAGLSLGTVFMGANTYIGNAPNFMVKSIAEQANVRMPSFMGFVLYSLAVLVPVYIGVSYLFLL
jgi:Na+/H+ antiporter NhaD/arsenite permease-like protein